MAVGDEWKFVDVVVAAADVDSFVAAVVRIADAVRSELIADSFAVEGSSVVEDLWAVGGLRAVAGSSVVVVTSGFPRQPGMTREDLIGKNAEIVRQVGEGIKEHAPDSVIIMVTNPLDLMTYHMQKVTGFPKERVVGQAGVLDSARMTHFIAEAVGCSEEDVSAMVLGGHGDTMVPLPRYTTVSGIPVTELIKDKKLHEIIERTKFGGGELVKLMGTSAWYAPGAAAAQMVESIVKNQKRIFPVCVKLEGEYNIDDCYLGVPVILGSNGIEKVIELDLNSDERTLLEESRSHVKEVMSVLENL